MNGDDTVNRDIVCIGASAGGLQPLRELVNALPGDLRAALFVVVHMGPDNPGVLASLLQAKSRLPVEMPTDAQKIVPGCIYVAPPDHHLLVKRDRMRVVRGPRENGFRPAVDPLFRTAARAYGARVIGIVLSGGLDDGADGLLAIRRHGGVTIVQDPEDAQVPQMPLSALAKVDPDLVLEAKSIAAAVVDLCREPVKESAGLAEDDEADPAELIPDALPSGRFDAPASPYTCPECGGVLREQGRGEGGYRCHVGHAFSPHTLLAAKDASLEGALWTALRILEENVAMRRRMADRAGWRFPTLADAFRAEANEAEGQAAILRKLLLEDDVRAAPIEPPQARRAPRRGRSSGRRRGRKNSRSGTASGRGAE